MYGKPGRRKKRLNAEGKNGQIALWGLYGNKAAALAISMCLRVFLGQIFAERFIQVGYCIYSV